MPRRTCWSKRPWLTGQAARDGTEVGDRRTVISSTMGRGTDGRRSATSTPGTQNATGAGGG